MEDENKCRERQTNITQRMRDCRMLSSKEDVSMNPPPHHVSGNHVDKDAERV
jgi:hypothetical protein